jgi:hypothetical protein
MGRNLSLTEVRKWSVSQKARSLIATEPRSLKAMSTDQYRFAPAGRSGDDVRYA